MPDFIVDRARLKLVSEALCRGDIDSQQIPQRLRARFLEHILGSEELMQLLVRLACIWDELLEGDTKEARGCLRCATRGRGCHDVEATLKRADLLDERRGQLAFLGGQEHLEVGNLSENPAEEIEILRKECIQASRALLLLEMTCMRTAFYRAIAVFVASKFEPSPSSPGKITAYALVL